MSLTINQKPNSTANNGCLASEQVFLVGVLAVAALGHVEDVCGVWKPRVPASTNSREDTLVATSGQSVCWLALEVTGIQFRCEDSVASKGSGDCIKSTDILQSPAKLRIYGISLASVQDRPEPCFAVV
ncbi:hypothetical protein DOTSEDRAFT_35718 [Dothistroma septosporum NZE10]|uniref:Uncharacterized protein n=1 Tax=Dothistroma septosporum (strain NZE10 / CBS 128990) TaxID=675120 RepID=M2WN72_DOTSN|nr:hypothetical protein DOTSEDRAFT_35718 [Dothistroma septosporum NZE10]